MKLTSSTIQRLTSQYGDWVLITGATSGIGRAMALAFGEAGFRLVITGRRESLLNELGTHLFDQYQVETIPLVGDLSTAEGVAQLKAETAHLPIGIAVLNAGYGTSGSFLNSELDQEINMLRLNCESVLSLSHHFANQFQARKSKGAIVLMSSMVSFQGVPNAAHYAATKAYVQSLGEALAVEWKPLGIDVLCAAPGPVQSGFAERADMKMDMALSPQQVAVPIIRAIGKKTTLLPGALTKLLVYNLRMTPRWLKVRIMGKVMGGFTQHQLG